MPDKTRTESPSPAPPKKSFSQYLIDTEIFPLPLLGKSIQYFGPKEVAVFLLGAAAVYGYSFYKPLPFSTAAPPAAPVTAPPAPIAEKMIDLRGTVTTLNNKPLTEFQVAVVRDEPAPFTTSDGVFTIQVPFQETYNLVIWEPGYSPWKFYGNLRRNMVEGQYTVEAPAFPEARQ